MEIVTSKIEGDNYRCHCPKCNEPAVLQSEDFCCQVGCSIRDYAIVICGKCNEQYAVD